MNKYEYDFIFSLGEDCGCTVYLKKFNLRKASYPFDWITNASFEQRIDMLVNNFKDFFNIEDFELIPNDYAKNDFYNNTKTGFYFYHDFPKNSKLSEKFLEVKEKYMRRITRLYNDINEAKNILIVWYSRDKILSDDRLKIAHEKLKNKFKNKEITLVILENDIDQLYNKIFCKNISPNIIKYIYDNASSMSTNPIDICKGNVELNNLIFSQFKIKVKIYKVILKKFNKLIIEITSSLIPINNLRRLFRNKSRKFFNC